MNEFIGGMKLCQLFFHEAVQPLLQKRFGGVAYSAAHLERGSDVLGFDTPQSRDHHWGPKVTLFVSESDLALAKQITCVLADELPFEVHGYPTHFENPHIDGGILRAATSRPINHGVAVTTMAAFFRSYIGLDPTHAICDDDWLLIPRQRLATIAAGKVFHDGLGTLEGIKQRLAWYPHDVWLYLLSNQWERLDQESPFMARCGDVGDEIGSRLVVMRQIQELMRLGFLIEKRYPPYLKWFGTAFSRLRCAQSLTPIFNRILMAQEWKEREKHLIDAWLAVGDLQNELALSARVENKIAPFHSRPYLVPNAGGFARSLHEAITSVTVRRWPSYLGGVDQFVDSTRVLDDISRCRAIAAIYREND